MLYIFLSLYAASVAGAYSYMRQNHSVPAVSDWANRVGSGIGAVFWPWLFVGILTKRLMAISAKW